jgi:hypothetical protein
MVGVKNDSLIRWEIGMEQSIFHLSFWAFGGCIEGVELVLERWLHFLFLLLSSFTSHLSTLFSGLARAWFLIGLHGYGCFLFRFSFSFLHLGIGSASLTNFTLRLHDQAFQIYREKG